MKRKETTTVCITIPTALEEYARMLAHKLSLARGEDVRLSAVVKEALELYVATKGQP